MGEKLEALSLVAVHLAERVGTAKGLGSLRDLFVHGKQYLVLRAAPGTFLSAPRLILLIRTATGQGTKQWYE